jgi:DNA (cytosine-5)-methyltransferase 1
MRALKGLDMFCGAGGFSEGAWQALSQRGRATELTAVNHSDEAIAAHAVNHPNARHFREDLQNFDPGRIYQRSGELDYLLAAPECQNHSVARSGPVNDQSRTTAHCVTRFVDRLRPKVVLVENVPQFADWAPLHADGSRDKTRRGETFQAWFNLLKSLGYKAEARVLCMADYGVPTSRQRLFVFAVREDVIGDAAIPWPEPTHGPDRTRPYVAAGAHIDLSIPAPWLHEKPGKPAYGGLPLSPNTLRRIHHGLSSGVLKDFLVDLKGTSPRALARSSRTLDKPLTTVHAGGGHHMLVRPYLVKFYGTATTASLDEPLDTITTRGRFMLLEPHVRIDGRVAHVQARVRMLTPRELAACSSFRPDYQFSPKQGVAINQIGNAVPPLMATHLMDAAYPLLTT